MKTILKQQFYNLSKEEKKNFTGCIIWDHEIIEYRKNGIIHRENGPAYIDGNVEIWYFEGNLHRLNGPAKIWNYLQKKEEYWIYGKSCTKEAVELFNNILKLRKH